LKIVGNENVLQTSANLFFIKSKLYPPWTKVDEDLKYVRTMYVCLSKEGESHLA